MPQGYCRVPKPWLGWKQIKTCNYMCSGDNFSTLSPKTKPDKSLQALIQSYNIPVSFRMSLVLLKRKYCKEFFFFWREEHGVALLDEPDVTDKHLFIFRLAQPKVKGRWNQAGEKKYVCTAICCTNVLLNFMLVHFKWQILLWVLR